MANRRKEHRQAREAFYKSEFARQLEAETERDLALHPERRRPLRTDETEPHNKKPEPYVKPYKKVS
jgi:hypothetical protein